jgi:hypothetical protein
LVHDFLPDEGKEETRLKDSLFLVEIIPTCFSSGRKSKLKQKQASKEAKQQRVQVYARFCLILNLLL